MKNALPVMHLLLCCLIAPLVTCAQDLGQIGKAKPVVVTGGVDLRGILYKANGIADRYPSSSMLLSGNIDLQLYGWSLPFSFSISDKNRSYAQPFNQFGVSPHYKWITLHAGYRNITYSPFTLGGYTMLGAGVELRPGKFRFGMMYGRLNKATVIDSITQSLTPVAYTRKGLAAKIGYGSDQNFFEFSALRASDDSASMRVNKGSYDSSLLPNAFPAENLVAGLTDRITIARKLVFESDIALSVYTRDKNSTLSLDSADDVAIIKNADGLMTVNGTTDISTAVNASIAWKEKNYQLKFQYRRIDPNFKSMGAYFLNTDLENYTFAPSFKALKSKLRFNGSIGFQNDNLDDNKRSTSKRVIGSANLSADLTSKLGIDINFSNYSINQQPNTTLFADTLKITQTTYNFSVMPRYILAREAATHVALVSVNYMKLNDFNTAYTGAQAARTLDNINAILSYQLTLNPSSTTVGASFNYTILKSDYLEDKNYGITLNGDQAFLKNKLVVRATVSMLQSLREEESSMLLNSNLQFRYRVYKRHFVSLQGFLVRNSPKIDVSALQRKYTESRLEAAYNFNF